jgi:hypothetical protein
VTDRVNVLHVALERDMRDDDVEPVIAAIKQIRCVADVQVHVADFDSYAARERQGRRVTIEPEKR